MTPAEQQGRAREREHDHSRGDHGPYTGPRAGYERVRTFTGRRCTSSARNPVWFELRGYGRADLQKLSNCPLMTAAAVDSAGAKLSTHDHERLHTGSAGAHPSRKFSSRAPRAAEAVDSPAPAVDSRASCPPTPPYLSTHEYERLDTCSAGRASKVTIARTIVYPCSRAIHHP